MDVGLSVRILEDAYARNFSSCCLYTSDVDYMPVIRSVQRLGKTVIVLGYADGLSKHSPLQHEPDSFVDLGAIWQGELNALRRARLTP